MKPEQTIQFLAELLELAEELNRIVKQYSCQYHHFPLTYSLGEYHLFGLEYILY
jgi:hypothetical protein